VTYNTSSLPTNPASGGTPASDRRPINNAAAKNGERFDSPLYASSESPPSASDALTTTKKTAAVAGAPRKDFGAPVEGYFAEQAPDKRVLLERLRVLVTKGVPFRSAHEIVARAVREALDQKKQLNEIDLSAFSPFFSELPPDYLSPENIVNRKGHSPALKR